MFIVLCSVLTAIVIKQIIIIIIIIIVHSATCGKIFVKMHSIAFT